MRCAGIFNKYFAANLLDNLTVKMWNRLRINRFTAMSLVSAFFERGVVRHWCRAARRISRSQTIYDTTCAVYLHARRTWRKLALSTERDQKLVKNSHIQERTKTTIEDGICGSRIFRGGDFGNPSERSERALRCLGLRENEIWAFVS